MNDAPSRRATLIASTSDGMACNVMVGLGETYFCAFLLAAGKSETLAGLMGGLPLLAGAILQLATPTLLKALGSHKRWVVACAIVQASAIAYLTVHALEGVIATSSAFFLISMYWAASYGGGAAWNSWIERLVPQRIRPRYFTQRNRYLQVALMLAMLMSGAVLSHARTLAAFAALFAIAAAARGVSAFFLSRHTDIPVDPQQVKQLTFRDFFDRLMLREDGRVMRYALCVQAAVYLASPYFTPFMLGKLHYSYAQFMMVSAAFFVGKIAIYPVCARVIAQHGPKRLLWMGGIGMVLLPMPWMLTSDFATLCGVQVWSGFAWGSFETATFFLYLKTVPNNERVAMMSMFNVCNASAMVLGTTVGGLLLASLGSSAIAYAVVFGASTVMRCATLVALKRIDSTPVRRVVPEAVALLRPAFAFMWR